MLKKYAHMYSSTTTPTMLEHIKHEIKAKATRIRFLKKKQI